LLRSGAYVVVGDQGALDGCADEPVVPDGGVAGEEPLEDPRAQARHGEVPTFELDSSQRFFVRYLRPTAP